MSKPFLNYDEQIIKLTGKGLIIDDEELAKEKLKEVGYYTLITGYKELFRNRAVKKYKRNVHFEDISALYELDRLLRELFFRYIQIIERTFGSNISYYFCEKFGSNQSKYLDSINYNNIVSNTNEISSLIGNLNKLANENTDYSNINYNRDRYNNVPLWILINHVTMGNKVKMYRYLTSEVQSKISIEYPGLTEDDLEKVMRYITKFRNVCAHGNRLYNHKTRANMPDTFIHEKLDIYMEGEQFVCGKRDLFGVVIAFRYLLSKPDFRKFKIELDRVINSYLNSTSFLNEIEILNEMGFPENWKKISRFHSY